MGRRVSGVRSPTGQDTVTYWVGLHQPQRYSTSGSGPMKGRRDPVCPPGCRKPGFRGTESLSKRSHEGPRVQTKYYSRRLHSRLSPGTWVDPPLPLQCSRPRGFTETRSLYQPTVGPSLSLVLSSTRNILWGGRWLCNGLLSTRERDCGGTEVNLGMGG